MKVPKSEKDRKILDAAVTCLWLYGPFVRGANGHLWDIINELLSDLDNSLTAELDGRKRIDGSMTTTIKTDSAGKIKLSEADVSRQVCDFLAAEGWRGVRMNVGTSTNLVSGKHVGFGEVGMPDWLFINYNYVGGPTDNQVDPYYRACTGHLWIEMKAPGKKPTPKQLAWHEAERARGALVIVVDHFETFRDWYKETFG